MLADVPRPDGRVGAKIVALVGRPGAGKGTQARLLGDKAGVETLSTGDLLRRAATEPTPLGRAIDRYVSRGFLVPDRLALELVWRALADLGDGGVLLDGFPRNIRQALALEAMNDTWGIDLAVELHISAPAAMARLTARSRADDSPDVVRRRLEVYERTTVPMIDWFRRGGRLATVDAGQSAERVHTDVCDVVARRLVLPTIGSRSS